MKKVRIMIVCIPAAVFLFVLTAAPFVNDNTAKKTADKLANLPLPDNTELIETVYRAGKLVGNGNGMQYFGAILMKSGLSLEELKEYYLKYGNAEWECVVENQIGTDVKIIEHTKLTFQTNVEGDNYYIVYSWGDNHTIFHELDVRGH